MRAKKIEIVGAQTHEDRFRRELAEAIIELRKSLGMSQTKFGTMMGVRQGTIVRWEKGTSKPQPSHLKAMAILSPPRIRHIFEDAAKTTIAQISMDRKSRIPHEISESSNNEDRLAIILDAVNKLYLRAQGGDHEAQEWLLSLARMLMK